VTTIPPELVAASGGLPPGLARAVASEHDASFVVELTAFSGPLDLLLTLIRDEKLDIYDIPIARVAEQFLRRIRTLGLNEAADYLEMAARLLRIKAQMLLPRGDAEAWEDPRAELVRRLLEYQQMREIVDVLEHRADDRRDRFARAFLPDSPVPPQAPLALSLSELLSAVDRVLRAVQEPNMHDVVARPLDVPMAISLIRSLLAIKASMRWTDVVQRDAPPWQVLSALLGLLELARIGELRVAQARPFANVEISRDVEEQAPTAPLEDDPTADVNDDRMDTRMDTRDASSEAA
jgi:segregation and condensation protein A